MKELSTAEEITWALRELDREIDWRERMLERADSEAKRRYWEKRIEDAKRLRELVEDLWRMHLDDLQEISFLNHLLKEGKKMIVFIWYLGFIQGLQFGLLLSCSFLKSAQKIPSIIEKNRHRIINMGRKER